MTREEAQQAWEKMRSEIDNENWLFVGTINPQMVDMAIEALQDRPSGKWRGELKMPGMPRYEWYRCSECRFLSQSVVNYCPNCGADMRGENEWQNRKQDIG